MADIKISELTEETNPNGLYVVAAKQNAEGNTYTSCKYNIGSAFNAVEAVANKVVPSATDAFDTTKTYWPGNLVSYTPEGGTATMYRCVVKHLGAWNDDHFTATTAYAELCALTSANYEKVTVTVSGLETLSGITATATFEDGTTALTATTNESGIAIFSEDTNNGIPREKVYTISVSYVSGYVTPAAVTKSSTVGTCYISMAYTAGSNAPEVDVTVNLVAATSESYISAYDNKMVLLTLDNGFPEDIPVFATTNQYYVGQLCKYQASGEPQKRYRFTANHLGAWTGDDVEVVEIYDTPYTATTSFSNGVATLRAVPGMQWANIQVQGVDGYVRPAAKRIYLGQTNAAIDFSIQSVANAQILWVFKKTDSETGVSEWVEATDYSSYVGSAEWTLDAIHCLGRTTDGNGTNPANYLANPNRNLIDAGDDYYIRPKDLMSKRTTTTKQWCSKSGTLHPNVTLDVLNTQGALMTYHIVNDSYDMGATSTGVVAVNAETYTYKEKVYRGFMGTRAQWQCLIDNYTAVKTALEALLDSETYGTVDYWSKYIWTATQSSASHAWLWLAGRWYNYNYGKGNNYLALPFFAI